MNIIRIFFLIIPSILLILIGPLSILSYSLNQTILKPYSTVDYIKESGMFEGMERIIPKVIKGNNPEETEGQEVQIMKEALLEVIQKQITEEWMYNKLNFMETEIWDYILHEDNEIEGIDISDVSTPYNAAVKEKLLTMYPKEMVEEMLKEFELRFEDKLNWADVYGVETESLDEFKMYYEKYKQISLWLNLIFLTIVLSFLVIFKFPKMLRWFGVICMIISGIASIPFVTWTYFFNRQLLYSKIQLPTVYKELEGSIIELIELVTNNFFKHLSWISLTVFFLGIILLIFSSFTKKHNKSLELLQNFLR